MVRAVGEGVIPSAPSPITLPVRSPALPYPIDTSVVSFLDAINRLITSVGSDPVTTTDPSVDSDIAIAINFLTQKNIEIQSYGWAWNSDEKRLLPLNVDGTISVPGNTLNINAAYWADTGKPMLVSQNGGLLYDLVNETTVFSAPVQVDIIYRFDWDSLPQPFKNLITAEACFGFQATKQGAGIVAQVGQRDIQRAWATCEHAEAQVRPANQIGGNLSVMRGLYGSGVRRNRGVF